MRAGRAEAARPCREDAYGGLGLAGGVGGGRVR